MHRLRSAFLAILWIVVGSAPAAVSSTQPESFDVVVYGATPGGIATAIPIARRDASLSIALVTPYKRVGGMMTNGLTHPDFRTFEARTGLFRELNRRVEKHYRTHYGDGSPQVKHSLSGTHAGPEVNYRVLRQMLDELPGITVLTEHGIESVRVDGRRVREVVFRTPKSERRLRGKYFVDATYEGDLMAAAGVPYRVGREGRPEYQESLAPPSADDQLQGYNFRITMTDRPNNRVVVPMPKGYDRAEYLPLLTLLRDGAIRHIFGDPYRGLRGGIYKRQTPKLPNGKRDINDVSHSKVRLSLPHLNNGWPEGDEAARQAIFDTHVRHNFGMLYFLQNDAEVPKQLQAEARSWGLCKDEWTANRHMPEQLYVREGRRMVGRYVFTQRDTERLPGSNHARAIFHTDAIAMGDYGPNCHGTDHEGPTIGGRHTGEFYQRAAPYQIPYGTLLPKSIDNLAVPVAALSSHVGFCALRLEPIWMSMGQAAGEAIGIALKNASPLHEISAAEIRERLHASGTATIYTSDVSEESPDFAAVQWWGSLGGFIPLDRTRDDEPADYGQRGKQLIGQYHAAFPNHTVELEQPLSDVVRRQWNSLAKKMGLESPPPSDTRTRGDYIRVIWDRSDP